MGNLMCLFENSIFLALKATSYVYTSPDTGDNAKTLLWIILIVVSVALVVFVLFGGKKKNTAKHLKKK